MLSLLRVLQLGCSSVWSRERSPAAKAGLRTLALVGFMMIASYWRKQDKLNDPGTTTVAAILVCYGLGALVWYEESMLAVMLAIITTILLYIKTELRGIAQNLGWRDLISILQFAVLSFIILPVLGGVFLLGSTITIFWWREFSQQQAMPTPETKNPAELPTTVRFGLLYAIVLFF